MSSKKSTYHLTDDDAPRIARACRALRLSYFSQRPHISVRCTEEQWERLQARLGRQFEPHTVDDATLDESAERRGRPRAAVVRDHRVVALLTEDEAGRLVALAHERGESVGAVARDLIVRGLEE